MAFQAVKKLSVNYLQIEYITHLVSVKETVINFTLIVVIM